MGWVAGALRLPAYGKTCMGWGGGCALLIRPTGKRAWFGAAGALRLPALRENVHGLGGGCALLIRPTVRPGFCRVGKRSAPTMKSAATPTLENLSRTHYLQRLKKAPCGAFAFYSY